MQKRILLFLLMLMLVSTAVSAKMTLVIEGLSGKLKENVDTRLLLIDPNRIDDTPYFKRYLESEVKKSLRALGYYSPTFAYRTADNNHKSRKLIVTIKTGSPVLIEKTEVNITGEGSNDKDYISLLQQLPQKGAVLNHGEYDSFKQKLQNLALRKGYFDADMTKHQLAVADKLHQAFWQIDFNTGKRYKFGAVTFNESLIRQSYLRNIIPFEQNEPYMAEQLSLLNRRLSSTNWFSSVSVIPLFDKMNNDGSNNEKNSNENVENVLPIHVITVPRKKNIVDIGLGYSSDNSVRGKLGWNKPWLNPQGHSFQSDLALSSPEQMITAVYKIPLYESPLENYYTIQGGYKVIDNNDTDSKSYSFGVIRNWDSFEGWQSAVGLNMLFDNFTQANDNNETFLLYPSFSFSRARVDGNPLPLWGDFQRYSIDGAAEDLASGINFIHFQIQQVWIRSITDNHRFIVRGNLGVIQASNFDRVPPSFRFFAGGDRSVRGFTYQSISPKDSNGKLKGASKLVTGSLEYQYNMIDTWWSAVFVDTGEAIDKFDKTDFHTGAGVGVRWGSPIGSFKFDVAVPMGSSKKSAHFYIGLGAEF